MAQISSKMFTEHTKTFTLDTIFDATLALQDAGIPEYGLMALLLLALDAASTKTGMLKYNLMKLGNLADKSLTISIDEESCNVEVTLDDATVGDERGH